ncbi:MAG: hypothetical protein HKN76_03305, partial [Saprospiraceae bacterium]|nr:hypothetical protein [Saprospiraceae bacterium]
LRRTRLLPGVYEFTISDANNCILSDSVEILSSEICQLEIESSITASGCDSSGSVTLNLTGVRGEANVVWSKTEIPNTRVVQGLSAGRYWVTVRDEFCEVSDTFDVPVNDIEDVVFQIGQSLCDARKNTFKIISVKGGTDPYQLNLNGQSIQLTNEIILDPGTHNLRVNDSKGCVDNSVFMVEPASDIRLQRDTTIKLGEELTLFGQLPGPEDSFLFRWIERKGIICEQCRNITISPTATSKYIFEVEDASGCRSRQEYNIRVDSRNLIYIPNAFTPNGDGLNDAFIVYDGLALIEEIVSLDIFDRRGMKIYQAKNLTTNEEAPDFTSIFQEVIGPQVYMYIIEIRFKQGYKQSIKGDFIIVK